MEASQDAVASLESAAKEKPGGVAENGLNVIGMVLAAVGGGIGVLSFVAFFGAAILWVRMDEAGMPANEAVAVVPKSVLLTTGASFLVPALLVALGFTVVLYLLESLRELFANSEFETRVIGWAKDLPSPLKKFGRGIGKLVPNPEVSAELEIELGVAKAKQEAAEKAKQQAAAELERGRGLESTAEFVKSSGGSDAEVARLKAAAEETYRNVAQLSLECDPEAVAPDEAAATPTGGDSKQAALVRLERRSEEESVKTRVRAERGQRGIRIGLIVSLFFLGTVFLFNSYSIQLLPGRIFVLALLSIGLTAVCVSVLSRTNFAWFAIATFVSVGVYVGILTYYRTVDDSKVEPVAMLRANGVPMYGFFVAQTSDRIYLGTTLPHGEFRLDAISRDEVTDMTVGKLEPTATANGYGLRMAIAICQVARERSPGPKAPSRGQVSNRKPAAAGKTATKAKQQCTKADLEHLRTVHREDIAERERPPSDGPRA